MMFLFLQRRIHHGAALQSKRTSVGALHHPLEFKLVKVLPNSDRRNAKGFRKLRDKNAPVSLNQRENVLPPLADQHFVGIGVRFWFGVMPAGLFHRACTFFRPVSKYSSISSKVFPFVSGRN